MQHPSIGLARLHPYPIKCGPFNAIQMEIEADGEPMHIGVELESSLEANVPCYGIVTSKLKGWATF